MPALGPHDLLKFNEDRDPNDKVYVKIQKFGTMAVVSFVDSKGRTFPHSSPIVNQYYGKEPERLSYDKNPLGRRLHKSDKLPFPWGEVSMHSSKVKDDGKCLKANIIGASFTNKGWGPMLYDLLLQIAGRQGLTPDRGLVSSDASKVWVKYYNNRPDVLKRPLDPIPTAKDVGKGKLTPDEPDDDCVSTHTKATSWNPDMADPEKSDQILTAMNYVYYGTRLKTKEQLKALGLLYDVAPKAKKKAVSTVTEELLNLYGSIF